jgi:hypothetical protein
MAVALLALVAALGGTAWAVGANGVGSAPSARDSIASAANGIVCNGTTDTTGAIQEAIDSERRPGGFGGRAELPAGTCVISKTLDLRGVAGMALLGQGAPTTNLRWRGDGTSPALLLDHTRHVRLEDFAITPARPLLAGVQIENGAGCNVSSRPPYCHQWASSQAVLRNLILHGEGRMTFGVHVALPDVTKDAKNDLHRFDAVAVSAYRDTAFRLDGRNAKGLTFTGCICQGLRLDGTHQRVGQRCVDSSGIRGHGSSFHWHGGTALGDRDVDFSLGDRTDPVLISGVYSEDSSRFLLARDTSSPGARKPFPVTVDGVRFGTGHGALAKDGEVIRFYSSGPLTVRGSRWGSERGARARVRFRYLRGARPAAFVFMGNYTISTTSKLFPANKPTVNLGNVLRLR